MREELAQAFARRVINGIEPYDSAGELLPEVVVGRTVADLFNAPDGTCDARVATAFRLLADVAIEFLRPDSNGKLR